jgi:hypothetical protein
LKSFLAAETCLHQKIRKQGSSSMIVPTTTVPPRPQKPPTANRSSRTKTPRQAGKKNKPSLTLNTVRKKVQEMHDTDQLLLMKVFDDETIKTTLDKFDSKSIKRRERIYTPQITLSLFVQQVLTKDATCLNSVTLLNKIRKAKQLSEASLNTISYCDARAKLPLKFIESLTWQAAELAMSQVPKDWLWFGHRVLLVDGFVVNAPDMPANQEKYPQPTSQKAGLGFPQIRVCAAICLSTGVIADLKYGPVLGKKTGEQTLFRKMHAKFRPGDIVVADSNFESYRDMATLYQQGVYMVSDINGTRESPFTGRCKVIEETTKTLPRPEFNKDRFTRTEWEQLPETLEVRVIRYKVKGRKQELTIVTTLLDAESYPAEEIAKLYKHRWECELDIRSVKSVMGMTWLSCHTPAMLERELMTYILAYNLIRVAMCDAAKISHAKPRDLSFKNAKDSWLELGQDVMEIDDYAWLLWSIASGKLRKRPGRNEPRKIKRRSNKYEKMTKPRDREKAELVA